MNAPERIISEADVIRVHGYANFGSMTPREVLADGVEKYSMGYTGGSTQLAILLEHRLITKPKPGSYKANLTEKGKAYLRAVRADLYDAQAAEIADLRRQLADADLAVAEALRKAGPAVLQELWPFLGGNHTDADTWHGISSAVDAAVDTLANQDHLAEVQALRAERKALLALRSAIAVKGGSEHYPTEEAYLLACAAIEKHRASAAAALAEVARLKEACEFIAKTIRNGIVVKEGPHTVELPDGSKHSGPVVDYLHQLLPMIAEVLESALTPKGDTP